MKRGKRRECVGRGFVGELCGLFIGQAMFDSTDVDELLTRLYESAVSES